VLFENWVDFHVIAINSLKQSKPMANEDVNFVTLMVFLLETKPVAKETEWDEMRTPQSAKSRISIKSAAEATQNNSFSYE
jgi:hypothetical protein